MADTKRYERNIILNEVGIQGQQKLLDSKVLIAGIGGLGSNVIANLASAGVGHLGLVDFDTVEINNLNRQFIHKYSNTGKLKTESAKNWIKEYNPDINIKIYNVKLDANNILDVIKNYTIIVDCLDSFDSKFLLNEFCIKAGKILIHGGVSEFIGQVTTIIPKKSACLRCLIENQRGVVPKGIMSPVVSTIASVQSMEVIKLLLNIGKPLNDTLLTYNALKCDFRKIEIKKSANCPVCN